MRATWIRVTKKKPCAICGRGDWCTASPEIGLALCMRVQSDRPSNNSMGGWLHKIGEPIHSYVPPKKSIEPQVDFQELLKRWQDRTDHFHLDGFAMSLGVNTDALFSLGCAWSGQAWAFPMRNSEKVCGIRLRNDSGQKWAVKGSKQGLFIPDVEAQKTLYVLEGPTDTAAALSVGLYAIGRPSCLGCEEEIVKFIRQERINRAVIVTDNDLPGLRGAAKLSKTLPVMSCVWTPFGKDMREFVQRGGDRRIVETLIKDLVWQRS
jgi:hypothetical protein